MGGGRCNRGRRMLPLVLRDFFRCGQAPFRIKVFSPACTRSLSESRSEETCTAHGRRPYSYIESASYSSKKDTSPRLFTEKKHARHHTRFCVCVCERMPDEFAIVRTIISVNQPFPWTYLRVLSKQALGGGLRGGLTAVP